LSLINVVHGDNTLCGASISHGLARYINFIMHVVTEFGEGRNGERRGPGKGSKPA